ncbi:MAG: hypothetical protein RBQ91_06260, partial [Acholeplasma sp.]|nr:hypothetical protein [Acholeplasma sp.]
MLKGLKSKLNLILGATLVVAVGFILLNGFNEEQSSDEIFRREAAYATEFLTEEGTSTNPYVVGSKSDMDLLSSLVLQGNTFEGKYITVDASLSEIYLGAFTPIGSPSKPFKGNFDGYGVNFELAIDNPTLSYQGLFGYTQTGIIENLSVSGSVRGLSYVGGVSAQQVTGTIRNVYNTAKVEATGSYAGGITGMLTQGTLTQAYNRGEIIAVSYAGGVVGYSYRYSRIGSSSYTPNSITNVYSSGTATANTSPDGVIGYDNPGSYSGAVLNTRSNLYYDITVIANYDQVKALKPSTDPSTQGLNSGVMFKDMASKLPTGFTFKADADGYAYYPQLALFSDHVTLGIKNNSLSSVQVEVGDGLGTEDFPFLIRNEQDIEDLKVMINKGNTFKGFHFKVEDGVTEFILGNFSPIGSTTKPFYGSFDGNDAEFILNINNTAASYQAMFGYFGFGTIKNLSVSGTVNGLDYTAGVVGQMISGKIENVYNEAEINGRSYVAGIVGRQDGGTINNVYNNGDITATGTYAGGVVSFLYSGTLSNAYNRAEILANSTAGGVVGYSYRYSRIGSSSYTPNSITNIYSSGLVSANVTVGGVIGIDNTSSYSGAVANARSRIYYDTSVLVTYDQPRALKPEVTGNAYGKTTSDLVYGSVDTLGFPVNVWHYEPKSGTTAYYPQLLSFSNSSVTRISLDSYASTAYEVGDGLGTKEFPFLIRNKFDMDELSRKVLLGNTYYSFHFKVDEGISQIDLANFTPIGSPSKPFQGNFDGNGVDFVLAIDNPTLSYQGLFGYTQTGIIENLSVSGSVRGLSYVGGVSAQQVTGTIRNVYNTAKVEATGSYAGGITGMLTQGTLTQAYNRGEIIAVSYAGGVVGYSYRYSRIGSSSYTPNSITNVYSSGTATANTSPDGVIGYDNPGSYSGAVLNTRSNLYYDITVIANYDQVKALKPSTDPSTQGLNSGVMFKDMASKLPTGFTFKADADGYAYYPQLALFSDHVTLGIKNNSLSSVQVEVGDGLGTEDFPFLIRNEQDIEDLKVMINKGNTFKGFHFKVEDGVTEFILGNFSPIGSTTKPFYGSFDGNDAEFILNINNTAASYQAMFGYFGFGTIKNLSVSGTVNGLDYTAGVVGQMISGKIENVYNEAEINGRSYVAGIVGRQDGGTINNVYNNGDITATGTYAGGVVSFLYSGTLSNAYNRAEILANSTAGGVVGYSYRYSRIGSSSYTPNSITNIYSSGLVSANVTVGGVIGIDNTSSYSGAVA